MARILYSVQGVGMGHAMRSQTVIDHLRASGHQVLITANNKAYKFLKKFYPNVYRLKGVDFSLDPVGRVKIFSTLTNYLGTLPKYSFYNFKKLVKLIEGFNPQIIITDFEPFAQVISHFYRLPLISIDNQHRITHCRMKIPAKYYNQFLEAQTVVRAFIWRASYYLITDFAGNKVNKNNGRIFVTSPIVRKEVLGIKSRPGRHILVYMWSRYAKSSLPAFKQVKGEKFLVYGLNKTGRDGNIIYRPFSQKQIIIDMAAAKGIVANAGFTLISEALYLRKPLLVIPMGSQFEQVLNGLELERKGYGMMTENLSSAVIKDWLCQLPQLNRQLKKAKVTGNERLFKILDGIIKKEI